MPPYAGPTTPNRPGEVAGTLWLLAYLALAMVLIVLDHRGGWLDRARERATVLVQPLWMVAGWPGQIVDRVQADAGTLSQLTAENARLRNEALVNSARLARLQAVSAENARLRELMGAAEQGSLDVQLAAILDIDLDPSRQRLVIDAGSGDGVTVGQSVIDAGGLMGQVTETTPMHATVLLLTDASHAIPVTVARNGIRLVAYGTGQRDRLELPNIPMSSDIKVGDTVVSSGLGGRFPAGFLVGTVTALQPDDSRAFLLGELRPAARLDRGRNVLLLRESRSPGTRDPEPEGEAVGRDDVDRAPGSSAATGSAQAPAASSEAPRATQPPGADRPGSRVPERVP
ncbi:rod shape-determining protein MreC [Marilutibacter chinensis]|uniref:Cell shape-determining protein MreC n=1 Tax=Marilutibacter chinensis TaxID=2912247 RepID=A0ABS9HTS7_9GAMM|nr:rod shape-determining protein MreC [Lysobacter chinensis]